MQILIDKIISSPELGIFGLLFLYTFYLLRKDAEARLADYRNIVSQLIDVVKQNTEANTRLHQSIESLHDKISQ